MDGGNRPRTGIGIACALLSATCYGLNPPITALLNGRGVVPAEAVVVRSAILFAVATILVVLYRRPLRVPQSLLVPFAAITVATAAMNLCYLSAVAFIPVGLAVIILYTFPLLVLVLSPIMEGNRLTPRRVVLPLVAFSGLVVAIGPSLASLDLRGIGLAAIAAISATAIFFSGRKLAGGIDPAANAFWVHLLGLPFIIAAAVVVGRGGDWLTVGGGAVVVATAAPALALGVLYAGGYLFMMSGLRHAPPSRLTPFYNIEPVVSISAAAVLVGERLEVNQYFGAGLVIAALVLAGVTGGRRQAVQEEKA